MDMAINSGFRKGGGDGREDTLFMRVVSFNKQAESVGQYLKKGSPVLVDGRLKERSWEAEDGSKRYRTEVVASVIQFLPRGGESREPVASSDSKEQSIDIDTGGNIPDDEIPF